MLVVFDLAVNIGFTYDSLMLDGEGLGRAVHSAWRDKMKEQGRDTKGRDVWVLLSNDDKELDEHIAREVLRAYRKQRFSVGVEL